MPNLLLLDTNVIIRHLTQDHSDHSPRSTAFLQGVEDGSIIVFVPDTVVFEAVYVLEALYGHSRVEIQDWMLAFVALPGVRSEGAERLERAFSIFTSTRLSFADAYHAVRALELSARSIVSFDRGLDRVPDLVRVEP